jgi:hypothetical protein
MGGWAAKPKMNWIGLDSLSPLLLSPLLFLFLFGPSVNRALAGCCSTKIPKNAGLSNAFFLLFSLEDGVPCCWCYIIVLYCSVLYGLM